MHAYWHAQPWKSESSKQSNHTHNGGLDRRSQSMSASNFDTCRILEPKLSDLCSRHLMQRGQPSWTRSWMTTEVALRSRLVRWLGSGIRSRMGATATFRSEEPTSELQSPMRNSYAVLCSTTK